MTPLLSGFASELAKTAGVGKALLTAVKKHPTLTLGGIATAGLTGAAAHSAYKSGRAGEQKPRYLHASIDPVTGKGLPSRAAFTNYNVLFKGKPGTKDAERLHGKYKEKAFRIS